MKDRLTKQFFWMSALALFVRFVFISHPGFLADIAYWKWWTKDSAEHGLVHTITETGINYPPLYLVVMKSTGHIYSLFSSLDNDKVYWDKGNLLFLFLIKLPFIAADLVVGYAIFWFVRRLMKRKNVGEKISAAAEKLPLVAAGLWLFNPGVIYNAAIWGQTDSLGVLPIILAYVAVVFEQPLLSGVLTGIAFFLKAQSIPIILFLYLYLYLRYGLLTTVKSAAAGFLTGLVVTAPFFLNHTMDRIIETIFTSVGYFPWASLYAFNLWWLVIRGMSFQFPDQTMVAGLLSYRTIGFGLFWSSFGILSLILWARRGKDYAGLTNRFLVSSALLALAMFVLPTEIHERYLLPFFAFATLPMGNVRSIFSKIRDFKFYIGGYIALSIIWLLNLHFVMIKNYPENELPVLATLSVWLPTLGLWFSAINVGLLALFWSWFLSKNINRYLLMAGLVIPTGLLILEVVPTIAKKSQSTILLTNLRPIFTSQSWGNLQIDKSVMGNNLSTWYFFSWKGLGTHAKSQIDYDLSDQYRRLETNVGVDTDGGEAATVEFLIMGDGKVLARSGIMKKWQLPKHLVANIEGVEKLSLIVSDAGDGINGDHADWLYPTLYK